MIESLPKRASITVQMAAAEGQDATELADFQKQDWNELDKAGKLVTLKDKFPELYKLKFKSRFGVEPKIV